MKRLLIALLAAALLPIPVKAAAVQSADISVAVPSAVLIERSTGEILYEKNAYEHLAPASVTKVMTMLLIAEAVDGGTISLDDSVTASARAASMGGSQIWLEEGEKMSVGEMLKCITVVSANDCCVAMAEHLAGTEEAFVARMNQRAAELGMNDTHFVSCSGLSESDEHYSCARDIAVMSRELLQHDLIRNYTTIWMDTIRGGEFGLSNTNKLIYYYDGATGLKTGFTSKAMYCLSASAQRDGIEYIAVVLHGATSAERFDSAKTLLNYGFANYTVVYPSALLALPPVELRLGVSDAVQPVFPEDTGILMPKNEAARLSYEADLPEILTAPVQAGQVLGTVDVYADGTLLRTLPVVAADSVARLSVWQMFVRTLFTLVDD